MGHDWNFGFMPYGERWRQHRRVVWQQMYPRAITKYESLQEEAIHRLLLRLLLRPQEMNAHIR